MQKIKVDKNKMRMAKQVAVTIPKGGVLKGLIMTAPYTGSALVVISGRHYSVAAGVVSPMPKVEVVPW